MSSAPTSRPSAITTATLERAVTLDDLKKLIKEDPSTGTDFARDQIINRTDKALDAMRTMTDEQKKLLVCRATRDLLQEHIDDIHTTPEASRTTAQLDALLLMVDLKEQAAKAEKEISAEDKPLMTQLGDGMENVADKVLPKEWTEKMTRNQKIAATAVGTAGVAVAAYFLFKAFNSIKSTTGRVVAGVAAVGGMAYVASRFFKFDFGVLGDIWKKGKEKGGELADRARDAASRARDEVTSDETREAVETGAEAVGFIATKKALEFQYDVAQEVTGKEDASPRGELLNGSRILLDLPNMRSMKMGKIFDCMDASPGDDAPFKHLTMEAYGADNFHAMSPEKQQEAILAMKFLVGYLKKMRPHIMKVSDRLGKSDVRDLTLADSMNAVAYIMEKGSVLNSRLGTILDEFVQNGSWKDIDLGKIYEDFNDSAHEMYQDNLDAIFAPARGSVAKDAEYKKKCEAVSKSYVTAGSVPLSAIESKIEWDTSNDKGILARNMKDYLRSDVFTQKVLSMCLIERPASGRDKDFVEATKDMLQTSGSMRMRDAFQLHALVESGSAAPLVMFKLINSMKKLYGIGSIEYLAAEHIFQKNVLGFAQETIAAGASGLQALKEKFNLSDEQALEMQNLSLYLEQKWMSSWEAFFAKGKVLIGNNPVIATATGAVLLHRQLWWVAKSGVKTSLGGTFELARKLADIQKITDPAKRLSRLKAFARLHNIKDFARLESSAAEVAKVVGQSNIKMQSGRGLFSRAWWRLKELRAMNKTGRPGFISRNARRIGSAGRRIWNGGKSIASKAKIPTPKWRPSVGGVLRVGGGVLSMAAAGMEGMDYLTHRRAELLEQYEKETDPLRKETIAREMRSIEIDIAINGGGGAALLFPPTAAVATAALTANMIAQPVRRTLDASTKYHTQTEKMMRGYAPGQALNQIDSTSEGLYNWGQVIAAGATGASPAVALYEAAHGNDISVTRSFDAMREGNEQVRYNAYRAYFYQIAMNSMMPYGLDDISDDIKTLPESDQINQVRSMNNELFSYFAQQATLFIDKATGGSLKSVEPDVLRRADSFARLKTAHYREHFKRLQTDPNAELTNPFEGKSEDEVMAMIDELPEVFDKQRYAALVEYAQKDPSHFKADAPRMLLAMVQHELGAAERTILSTDYYAWVTSDAEMQSVARGIVAERAVAAIRSFLNRDPSTVKESDIASVVTSLRSTLSNVNADALAQAAYNADQNEKYAQSGANQHLLSVEGIQELI